MRSIENFFFIKGKAIDRRSFLVAGGAALAATAIEAKRLWDATTPLPPCSDGKELSFNVTPCELPRTIFVADMTQDAEGARKALNQEVKQIDP